MSRVKPAEGGKSTNSPSWTPQVDLDELRAAKSARSRTASCCLWVTAWGAGIIFGVLVILILSCTARFLSDPIRRHKLKCIDRTCQNSAEFSSSSFSANICTSDIASLQDQKAGVIMSFHAKETIYLSLGSFANHITTHFFNEQDSYLDSANGADSSGTSQPWIDHDVSFRQGYSLASRTETYQPRAILFDVPSEFGSLRRINRLYAGDDGDNDEEQQAGLWPGQVETIRTAGPVGDSSYQIRLDRDERGESADDGDEGQSEGEDEEEQQGGTSSATANMDGSSKLKSRKVAQQVWRNLDREKGYRFWSDYLRVYYHPRSLVSLSGSGAGGTGSAGSGSVYRPMRGSTAADAEEDTQDEANTEASPAIPMEGFDTGYAAAREIERSMDVMDENVRWHAEDSDLLQVRDLCTFLNA